MPQHNEYQDKKRFYQGVLTVYGRKPVLEAISDLELSCHALHLAHSNQDKGIIRDIAACAASREIPIKRHDRSELARISRNGKQDQGVALDILCPGFSDLADRLALPDSMPKRLIAIDGVTNPQNLGMIIRSVAASGIDGLILSRKGNAALGPLVIKASAGTLFRAPLLFCDSLLEGLALCRDNGAQIFTLEAESTQTIFERQSARFSVYVLGNESHGVTREVSKLADAQLAIPMHNGVESLNVAVAAGLIAYAACAKDAHTE